MVDWTKPGLTDTYANVLAYLNARDVDTATQFVGSSSTNIPNGAIRWNAAAYRWDTYSSSGGTWGQLYNQLNIGTVLLGSVSASGTMQAVPRSQADTLYQAAGSYAPAGGSAGQAFSVSSLTLNNTGSQAVIYTDSATGGLGPNDIVFRLGASGSYKYATLDASGNLLLPGYAVVANATANNQAINLGQVRTALNGVAAFGAPVENDLSAAPLGWSMYNTTTANTPLASTYGAVQTVSSAGSASPGAGNWLWQFATDTAGRPTSYRENINGSGWTAWQQLATLTMPQVFTKTQSATQQALGNISGTAVIDLTQGNDVAANLSGNLTIANPSNMTVGTGGHIRLWQNTAGQYAVAFGSIWNFGQNGAPNWGAPNRRLTIIYYVSDTDTIQCSSWIGN
jgi:hypothetical protein